MRKQTEYWWDIIRTALLAGTMKENQLAIWYLEGKYIIIKRETVNCGMNDVATIEFKLVDSADAYPDDLKAGEAIVFEYADKTLGLILACPACGKAGSSVTGNHKYNPETKSVTPSLNNQCCGWHGHLTNGKFTN